MKQVGLVPLRKWERLETSGDAKKCKRIGFIQFEENITVFGTHISFILGLSGRMGPRIIFLLEQNMLLT